MRCRWLEGQEKGTTLDSLNKAYRARWKRPTQDPALMTKWALQPIDTSVWLDDPRQKLERGLMCASCPELARGATSQGDGGSLPFATFLPSCSPRCPI